MTNNYIENFSNIDKSYYNNNIRIITPQSTNNITTWYIYCCFGKVYPVLADRIIFRSRYWCTCVRFAVCMAKLLIFAKYDNGVNYYAARGTCSSVW